MCSLQTRLREDFVYSNRLFSSNLKFPCIDQQLAKFIIQFSDNTVCGLVI